jgi:hypothetical protein
MSTELKVELRASIHSMALSLGPYGHYNRDRPMYSLPKQERQ